MLLNMLINREFGGPFPWSGHFINNDWQLSKRPEQKFTSFNPNNDQILLETTADKIFYEQAITSAVSGLHKLSELTLSERLTLLEQFYKLVKSNAHLIARALMLEAGKPKWEAQAEIDSTIRYLEWAFRYQDSLFDNILALSRNRMTQSDIIMHPYGTVLAYLPFSNSFASFINYLSACYISGCPLVLFCPPQTSLLGALLCEFAKKIDTPTGIFNIVFGDFSFFRQLISDKRLQVIIYTGSREHCQEVVKVSQTIRNRRTILQTGGKNAAIVHSTADLNQAARLISVGAFKFCGQQCASTSRVFVYSQILPQFITELKDVLQKITIDRTDLAANPFMGPLYSKKAVERFLRFQTMAGREAKDSISWGTTIEHLAPGYFVSPGIHVMPEFNPQSAYQNNTLFSPDIAIYEYDNLNQVIDDVNHTDTAYCATFYGDRHILDDRTQHLKIPNILINLPSTGAQFTLPLSGKWGLSDHNFQGINICARLLYPQAIIDSQEERNLVKNWL